MKIKSIFILFLALNVFEASFAQSPFISQNFTAGQFFNPANVGFGGLNRSQIFYRSQFEGVGMPFKTTGVGVDFGFMKNEQTEPNNIGFGFQALSDQLLNGALNTNYISGTIADRIFLDDFKYHFLAIGLGATIITKTVDYTMLKFGDQYNAGRFLSSTSLDVINNFPTKSTINVGAAYTYNSPETYFQLGASSYFINRVSGGNSDTVKLDPRNEFNQINGQFNLEKTFNENNTLIIHANYQSRYEGDFYFVGGAIGIPFKYEYDKVNRFYVGCFYRSKDALIPYIGLMFNKYKFGITYDIYKNDMTEASLRPQTLEFSLNAYFGKRKGEGLRNLFD